MHIGYVRLAVLGTLSLMILGIAPSAKALQKPASASSAKAPLPAPLRHCNDGLSYFLPGYTEYCFGAKKWRNGNYDDALFDLKDAAGWANKNAQYTLGLIYFNGHHVPADRPLGLAWLLLAAERQKPQHYVDVAVSAYKMATPEERAKAVQLLNRMSQRYADAHAVHRAIAHFHHAMQSSVRRWGDGSGTKLCIAGLTPMGTPGHPQAPHGALPHGEGNASGGSCPPTVFVVHILNHAAHVYFKDALPEGHVAVGPLKQVLGPARDEH